jgi:hypothetical protein
MVFHFRRHIFAFLIIAFLSVEIACAVRVNTKNDKGSSAAYFFNDFKRLPFFSLLVLFLSFGLFYVPRSKVRERRGYLMPYSFDDFRRLPYFWGNVKDRGLFPFKEYIIPRGLDPSVMLKREAEKMFEYLLPVEDLEFRIIDMSHKDYDAYYLFFDIGMNYVLNKEYFEKRIKSHFKEKQFSLMPFPGLFYLLERGFESVGAISCITAKGKPDRFFQDQSLVNFDFEFREIIIQSLPLIFDLTEPPRYFLNMDDYGKLNFLSRLFCGVRDLNSDPFNPESNQEDRVRWQKRLLSVFMMEGDFVEQATCSVIQMFGGTKEEVNGKYSPSSELHAKLLDFFDKVIADVWCAVFNFSDEFSSPIPRRPIAQSNSFEQQQFGSTQQGCRAKPASVTSSLTPKRKDIKRNW